MSLILSGTDGLSDVDGTAATPAIRGTDANTGIFFGTDIIGFSEGGVEAARIDASGNFGLGVTPSAWRNTFKALQILGTATLSSNSNTTVYLGSNWYNNSSGADIYTVTGAAGIYAISSGVHAWYNAPSGTAGNAMPLTQAMTLNTNGVLALQGASTTATGVGITFPAAQSASTDVNTLDDYEEGTWTPAFGTTATGFSTLTYSNQSAYYIKVGKLVTIWGWVECASVAGGTGSITVTGLPFTNAGMQGGFQTNWANQPWSTNVPVAGHILTNSTEIYLIYFSATQSAQIPRANLIAGAQLIFNGSYYAQT